MLSSVEGRDVIAGRYSLKDEVGRGGMGVVWRGEDEVLGRDVALKRVGMTSAGATPDLARAEREARLAASLNHPHVVSVFDLVEEPDAQWLVMEYVESTTLAELVRERGPLSPDEAARILWQAADALAAAHEAGIVHRDVKPSNILVTPAGQAKLTDFGIARASADATLTQTGLVSGSPAYLSPEVATGGMATPASDVWALGATLFHALSGRPPYDVHENLVGALYQIVHGDPPRPENAGWLLPLLEHTMTREPSERWSMAQVRSFLAGEAPPAVGPPTRVLTRPQPTRRRVEPEPTGLFTPEATGAFTPVPTPVPEKPRSLWREHGWTIGLVAVAVALVAGVAFAWAVLAQGPDPSGSAPGTTTASASASSASGTGDRPTARGMRSFVEDYLATATANPGSTWKRLTPEFQDHSGGFQSYRGYWSTIEEAKPSNVTADPSSMTVSYTVTYQRKDGMVVPDQVNLRLTMQDGNYLIAGED